MWFWRGQWRPYDRPLKKREVRNMTERLKLNAKDKKAATIDPALQDVMDVIPIGD
ncbi:MAG: hypothetical protein R3322_00205 [Kiloniellales bacterium]|nr:hypothetical protein [Kiloniellales bacterium]